MERKNPMPGEIYRHFKNKLYQIVGIASHSETGEKLVIYQALYGEFGMCARPYTMFMSEVDHDKYPEVTQKYRFERVGMTGEMSAVTEENPTEKISNNNLGNMNISSDNEVLSDDTNTESDMLESGMPNPDLLAFLDAETYDEKYKLLVAMRPRITDRLINDFAASIDVTVDEGDLETRFRSLLYCVKKMDEFEVTRLR